MSVLSSRTESQRRDLLRALLVVYNSRANLERSVAEILDVLAEMNGRFELCLLDDGSTDDTADVARELANRYPQINVLRNPRRLGLARSIHAIFRREQSELLLLVDDVYRLEPHDLQVIWQLRDAQRRLAPRGSQPLLDELYGEKLDVSSSRGGSAGEPGGLQIVRRNVIEQMRLAETAGLRGRVDPGKPVRAGNGPLRPSFLGRVKQFTWRE